MSAALGPCDCDPGLAFEAKNRVSFNIFLQQLTLLACSKVANVQVKANFARNAQSTSAPSAHLDAIWVPSATRSAIGRFLIRPGRLGLCKRCESLNIFGTLDGGLLPGFQHHKTVCFLGGPSGFA